MVLELHILGPAFGLPSIDAECLAALTYVNRVLEHDQWVLIAAHDSHLSSTGEFPALRDESAWIGGYSEIVAYLHHHPKYAAWLNSSLDMQQHADVEAFSTLVSSRAQPLLDFSLYVSADNYASVTRPAFSDIIPRSSAFTIPPRRQAAAVARVKPLGLKSADLDNAEEQFQTSPDREVISNSQSILFQQRRTLGATLRQQHIENRFRLDNIIDAVMEPVQLLLGGKPYILTEDKPSSLDCLAYGYLALMVYPQLPNSWLADTIRANYPSVRNYVKSLRQEFFGDERFHAKTAFRGDRISNPRQPNSLPWHIASPPTWSSVASAVATETRDLIISPHSRSVLFGLHQVPAAASDTATSLSHFIIPTALSIAAPVFGLLSWLAYSHASNPNNGTHHFTNRPPRPASLASMGEAGAALAVLGNLYAGTEPRSGTSQEDELRFNAGEIDDKTQ